MNSCAVNGVGLFPAPSLGSDPSSQPTDGMRKAWRYMPQKNKYMRMAAVMLAGCNAAMCEREDLAAQGRAAASHAPLAVDLPACERARRRLAAEAGAGEPGAQPAEPGNESGVMRGARSPAGGKFSSSHVPCTAVGARTRRKRDF